MAEKPVVFDFDGVLVDTEPIWGEVRREVALAHGGSWTADANSRMQGLSSGEWTAFMDDELGTRLGRAEIAQEVIGTLERRLLAAPPFAPGAAETVRVLAAAGRTLAVASSSPRRLLDALLSAGELRGCFEAVVSSDQVARGKPSPDVYLEAAGLLGVAPGTCLAVEDSTNGLLAASAAGMEVWAVPNPHDPPSEGALARASRVGRSVAELFGTGAPASS